MLKTRVQQHASHVLPDDFFLFCFPEIYVILTVNESILTSTAQGSTLNFLAYSLVFSQRTLCWI